MTTSPEPASTAPLNIKVMLAATGTWNESSEGEVESNRNGVGTGTTAWSQPSASMTTKSLGDTGNTAPALANASKASFPTLLSQSPASPFNVSALNSIGFDAVPGA